MAENIFHSKTNSRISNVEGRALAHFKKLEISDIHTSSFEIRYSIFDIQKSACLVPTRPAMALIQQHWV